MASPVHSSRSARGRYVPGRASTSVHLAALDGVYDGVVSSRRGALAAVGEIDPISEDMLIGQTAKLELFQWFMRAHLEDGAGNLQHENSAADSPSAAADK